MKVDAELRGRRVLVTGAAGFIGSHLTDALVGIGAEVVALDNFVTGREANLERVADRIELVRGDIRDPAICRAVCRGVEIVLHQAALGSVPRSLEHPAETVAVNVTGFANLVEAARDAGAQRVVYASSSSVYGDAESQPKVEGEEGRPLSPYAWSKRMDEELAGAFADAFGLELIGLRYFNVYGPRQDPDGPYAAVVPLFFRACLEGESPLVHGDGGQSRDFTYVADAVQANLRAAIAGTEACGRAFNIAAGRQTTVLELLELIDELVGSATKPAFGPPRPGDVRHSLADPSLARRWIGFEARTELRVGLEQTLRFYRD